jgi:hypothetical protein
MAAIVPHHEVVQAPSMGVHKLALRRVRDESVDQREWGAKIALLKAISDKRASFTTFAQIDDLFEPLEDALYGTVGDMDEEINLAVDRMREP